MSDEHNITRRTLLAAAVGGSALAVGASGQLNTNQAGNLVGGASMLNEANNVAGDLWIGPDSTRADVSPTAGRVFIAADTQVQYYADGDGWIKMGIGSDAEPVPSVSTDRIDNEERVGDSDDLQQRINDKGARTKYVVSGTHDPIDLNSVDDVILVGHDATVNTNSATNPGNGKGIINIDSCSNVWIFGFDIDGAGTGADLNDNAAAVRATESDNIHTRDVDVLKCTGDGIRYNVRVTESSIENCRVTDAWHSFFIGRASTDCQMASCWSDSPGIMHFDVAHDDGNGNLNKNIQLSNLFGLGGSGQQGLYIRDCSGVNVDNVNITDNTEHITIHIFRSEDVNLNNATVEPYDDGEAKPGIQIGEPKDTNQKKTENVTITNTTVRNATVTTNGVAATGVVVYWSDDVRIADSTIKNMSDELPIDVRGEEEVLTIENSTIRDTTDFAARLRQGTTDTTLRELKIRNTTSGGGVFGGDSGISNYSIVDCDLPAAQISNNGAFFNGNKPGVFRGNDPAVPLDVRDLNSIEGNRGFHDGSNSNTYGPAFYDGNASAWKSLVDGTTVS